MNKSTHQSHKVYMLRTWFLMWGYCHEDTAVKAAIWWTVLGSACFSLVDASPFKVLGWGDQ